MVSLNVTPFFNMALPLNINELITGHTVESERIEFKAGWNPEDVLHTICAFANDFSNQGGGYIIIGIAENEGKPILPPKGLMHNQANKIQSELLNLCKQKIKPEYTPIVEPVTFQEKLILIIWCPGGQERPYEAPENLAKGAARYYYIRKFSNTVKPNKTEKEELLRFAAIPYDDRINHKFELKDLSPGLIRSFLQEIKSKLFDEFDKIAFIDLCRQMNLIDGPAEYIKPKNFALMFFNDKPEKIFPNAQIEVINFQTPTADKDFTEIIFNGPLHNQLKEALKYLRFQVIKEKVDKVSYQAEAIRYFNYPYEALEEILANAVYHRNYEINEPIEIRIHPDRIMVLSFPGPDNYIKMEDMQAGKVVIRRYRNRQIGNILKELKLTEGKCTGIPTILKSMYNNNSPKPLFETDDERQSLLVTIPIHKSFLPSSKKNSPTITSTLIILSACLIPKTRAEIFKLLGISNQSKNFKTHLSPMLSLGILQLTIPDKPNSKFQKYITTEEGKRLLEMQPK